MKPSNQAADSVLSRAFKSIFSFGGQWLHSLQILGVVALLSGATWVHTFMLIEDDRARVLVAAQNDVVNLGRLSQEHAERTFSSVDQSLKMVRGQYLEHEGKVDFQDLAAQGFFDPAVVLQVAMIDAQGILKHSSLPFTGRLDLSDRAHFKAHLASGSDALFISDAVLGRVSRQWSIQLSRRITLKNGQFGGVMVASIDLAYFTRFYADLDLGQNSVASLLKPDGSILARRFGKLDQFAGQLRTPAVIKRLAQGDSMGTFVFQSELDGIERIFHFKRLPSFPLFVAFAQATDVVLQAQQQTRRVLLLQAAGVTFLLFLFGAFIARYVVLRRKTAQAHLKALQQLQALTNSAPGVVYQYLLRPDGTGSFIFASNGVQDLFRLSPAVVMADTARVFSLIHPDDVASLNASVDASARNLAPWLHEFRIGFDDGAVRWLSGKSTPQKLADGSILWSGFMADVTEHKRIEAAANAANLAKTDFLSSMSHEIRSPLNAILGLAYLLEQVNLGLDANDMVRKIRASGRMLLSLISDILDVSKIEAGQMMIEQAPFRLTDVVDNLVVVLDGAVGEKNIKLVIAPPPAGVFTLMGDALRLEQVLINLCINAIKFTSVGMVALRIELLSNQSDEVMLRFGVRDTGIGIAPELQSAVFMPFTQADSSTTRRFGGTGLGLTISRQLVQLMGGEIGVNSVLGQGSEFWFTLVLKKEADADVAVTDTARVGALIIDDSEVGRALAQQTLAGQGLLGIRVLVVDDNDINCEVARRILHRQGAIVSLAADGLEALNWLLAHPLEVDLVLMDVQMPVMDGIEATRQLRMTPQFADLPIVALTAGAFKSQQDDAHAAGMTHFISKPFDVPSMIALIQRLCQQPVKVPGSELSSAASLPGVLLANGAVVDGVDVIDVAVMDVAQGLEIWMDKPSYLDYLRRFVTLYSNAVAVMRDSLAHGDRPAATALAHKLAGVAANLALPDTRRLAGEASQVLRSELDPTRVLAQLGAALVMAVAAIERFALQRG